MSENGNKMDGAESSLNGKTPDDGQPRSLEDSGIYSIGELQQPSTSSASGLWQPESQASLEDSGIAKEDGKTDIGSASGEKLGKHTRDDYEGKEISGAQKPVQDTQGPGLQSCNDQHVEAYSALLDRMFGMISKAQNDITTHRQKDTCKADHSQVVRNSYKIFDVAAALKQNADRLMAKFSFQNIHASRIETATSNTDETKVTVTSRSPYQSCRPKNRLHVHTPVEANITTTSVVTNTDHDVEMLPVDDYHQDAPDTHKALTSMYTSGSNVDKSIYEGESNDPEARPPENNGHPPGRSSFNQPRQPSFLDHTSHHPLQNLVAVSPWGRVPLRDIRRNRYCKRTEFRMADKLCSFSRSVGVIVKDDHLYGTCARYGQRHVMTSGHVASPCFADLNNPSNSFVEFNYYNEWPPVPPIRFPILYIDYMRYDGTGSLDFCLLQLDIPDSQFLNVQTDQPGLECYIPPDMVPLLKEVGLEKVTLVGHPDGDPKSFDYNCPVLDWYQSNEYADEIDRDSAEDSTMFHTDRINYRSTFWGGGSGSPVVGIFDDKIHVVAMHTQGYPTGQTCEVEQAVMMSAIQDDLKDNRPRLYHALFP